MRKPRSDGRETRRHLLCAASEVFASKGFWEATLAEICRKANANIAAANYHFGGKEALYVESWRYAFEKSLAAYPADGGVPADAPVGDRIYGQILSIMRRIIDPQSHDFDIIHKEMANPTGLLMEIIQESIHPVFQPLVSIIHELLGDQATDQQVNLCLMSIRAQCFGPMLRARWQKRSSKSPKIPGIEPLVDDLEKLADHVTQFSLAGIRDIREKINHQTNKYRKGNSAHTKRKKT
jgi:TetR/AcrR family transcriptional regulator, regulator of cefoperazone and chloramphenicol sensitivity